MTRGGFGGGGGGGGGHVPLLPPPLGSGTENTPSDIESLKGNAIDFMCMLNTQAVFVGYL